MINNPMDITTLTKNLNQNKYLTFSEFVKDAKLICQNCQKFNLPKSAIYKRAVRLMKFIKDKETKLNKRRAPKEVKRKRKIIVDDDESSIQENKITHQEDNPKTTPLQEKKKEVQSFLGKKRQCSYCDEGIDNSKAKEMKPIQKEVNAETEKKEPKSPKGKEVEISDYNGENKKRKIDKPLTEKTNIKGSPKEKKEEAKAEKREEKEVENAKESSKEKPNQGNSEMKDTSQTQEEMKESSSSKKEKKDIIPVVISQEKEEKKEQQPSKLEEETKRASECKEPNTISPIIIKDTQPEESKKIEINQLKAELAKLILELIEDDLIKVLSYIARKCPLSCEDLPNNTMAVHFDKCDYECIEKAVILGKGLMECTKVFSSLPPLNSPENEKKAMAK